MKLIWHKHPRLYNCTTNVCSVICLDPYYLNSIFRSSVITESWRDFTEVQLNSNWKKKITNGISAQSFDQIGSRDIYCFKLHSPNRPVKSCVTIFIRGISSKFHRKSRLYAHFNIAGWVARFFLFTWGAPPILSPGVTWAVAEMQSWISFSFPRLKLLSTNCCSFS